MDIFRRNTNKIKLQLKGKDGKPYYLQKLPFRKRNPKAFVIIGGVGAFLILYSKFIYDGFFKRGEPGPYDGWWPAEIAKGRRQVDVWREKLEKEKALTEAGISQWDQMFIDDKKGKPKPN